ncbi:MAG: hypothetical protein WD042_16265 [Phycisphaeraceae bacterium]
MQLALQVLVSLLIVLAVLWVMWRLPWRGEALYGWGPPLALFAAWAGLLAVVLAALLWVLPAPDFWISVSFLLLDPAALASAVLVLWLYRGDATAGQTIHLQRVQARAAIVMGLIAVTLGYLFVMTHKTPFTPVGTG